MARVAVSSRTEELAKIDAEHIIHSFVMVGENRKIIFERGEGCKLWDTNGREYIDIGSQLVLMTSKCQFPDTWFPAYPSLLLLSLMRWQMGLAYSTWSGEWLM